MQKRIEQFIANPKKALWKLSLPIIIGMLVQVLYNIVDTAFVGRLGAEAIAALTFSWPLFFVLISLNGGLGAGMNSRLSRYLGEKNIPQAENTATHGMVLSLVVGFIIFVLGMIFLKPLLVVFGASDYVLKYALDYMRIILVAGLFMYPSYIMYYIFAAQGDTKTPMKVQIIALVVNMILDPIFIYFLGLGVKGAAYATMISFLLSLIIYIYLFKKRSHIKINIKTFKFSWRITKEILAVGLPATIMMLLMSVYFIFINRLMASFDVETVAAFGIVARLDSVAVMPVVGLSAALITLVAMFYGAKRYDLLRSIVWYAIRVMIIFSIIIGFIFFVFPQLFLMIFTKDKNLINLGSQYLRIQLFTYPFMVIAMIIGRTMQGLGLGLPGLIINSLRMILIAVPLAYVFVLIFNFSYLSIAVASVIAAVIAAIVAIIWIEIKLKKLKLLI
ncbi:MATE family efflux transporter [Patescibacteria group bacterium]|nr:MATE family efflux transporter [Patescibacteria group bacterium]